MNYEKFQIFFVYSFLIKLPNTLEYIERINADKWSFNPPAWRKGLSPTIRIHKSLWAQTVEEDIDIVRVRFIDHNLSCGKDNNYEIVDKFAARISSSMRLCQNGSLISTIQLNIDTLISEFYLNLKHIGMVFSLTKRTENDVLGSSFIRFKSVAGTNKTEKLFSLFQYCCEKKEEFLKLRKTEVSEEEEEKDDVLEELGQDLFAKIENQKKAQLHCGSKFRIFESQNPFVITACQILKESNSELSWWKEPPPWSTPTEQSENWREVGSILLRITELDKNDIKEDLKNLRLPKKYDLFGYNLENMAWDDRLYIAFHPRSCVFLTHDLTEKHSKFMLPSLVDVMETLRGHWYASVIINALLDDLISQVNLSDNYFTSDIMQTFLYLRRIWAMHLHDPTMYNFEWGSITKIALMAQQTMGIDKLSDLTYRKFEVLEKVWDDQIRLYRAQKYEEYHKDGDEKD